MQICTDDMYVEFQHRHVVWLSSPIRFTFDDHVSLPHLVMFGNKTNVAMELIVLLEIVMYKNMDVEC